MIQKTELRQHFRHLRNQLTAEQISHAAQGIKEKLQQHSTLKTAKKIGAYLPINNELDLSPSLEMLKAQGKEIFLPILHPWHNKFWFAPWRAEMRNNKFGIPEPIFTAKDLLAPWELDVVLVPLLAVDKKGHRLGMGKGFYDQSFVFKKWQDKPYLIGCAYQFQLSPTDLPHEPFDILMDEIIVV